MPAALPVVLSKMVAKASVWVHLSEGRVYAVPSALLKTHCLGSRRQKSLR